MAIKDLVPNQGFDEIIGTVVEVGEARTFNKFGKEGRVSNVTLQDETGKVKLSLFNEQVDQIKLGDKVKIEKGYCKEWQGEKQVSAGRFGKMEVLEGGAGPAQEPAQEPAPEDDKKLDDEGEQMF